MPMRNRPSNNCRDSLEIRLGPVRGTAGLAFLAVLACTGCDQHQQGNHDVPDETRYGHISKHEKKHDSSQDGQGTPTAATEASSEPKHGHDLPKSSAKWYLTMHGEPAGNTVHAISADGQLLGNILEPVPESAGGAAKGVRGMLHLGQHGLMLVSANLADTRLLRYGAPASDGTLPFVGVFASKELKDPELVHSYALAVGANGVIYSSNQDTDTVTGYWGIGSATPGQTIPIPAEIVGLGLAPGTIVPRAGVSPQGITEIRGIAIGADGLLYVCDRNASQVVVFDPHTGLRKGVLADASSGLVHPIQLLFAPDGHTVYLSDNGVPAVFRIDTNNGALTLFTNARTGCPELPSSLAMDNEHLYVGDRKKKQILRFKLHNAQPDRDPFCADLPDAPEFMIPASAMPPVPNPPATDK